MTNTQSRPVRRIGLAFLLLCAVSAYRQVSRHLFPGDYARPVVVYAVYVLLLACWWGAIRARTLQADLRRFLLAEHAVMLIWATVRFVQEALLWRDIYWMRVSGYLVSVPLALLPLLGLYAAFGLSKPAEYRLDRRWYLLLLPALGLILLTLTNESHHLVFRTLPGETAVNLNFHPGGGLYVLLAWCMGLEITRAVLICRRSRKTEGGGRRKTAPFLLALAMLAFTVPYLALSFAVDYELIEYSAALLFLEALVWEGCISLGLILVNTRYAHVFHRSTVAMQILDDRGRPWLRSAAAPALTAQQMEALVGRRAMETPEGIQLHLEPIPGGWVVWQTDVSQLRRTEAMLRETEEALEQEGSLLRRRWAARSQEASVRERSRLYDQLTAETGGQLARLETLLDQAERAAHPGPLFWKICLLGTYIKRRCALRLLDAPGGTLPGGELELCLRDLLGCLPPLGVQVRLLSHPAPDTLSPAFALFALDSVERLLEAEDFTPRAVEAGWEAGALTLQISPAPARPRQAWSRPPDWPRPRGCTLDWRAGAEDYRLTLGTGRWPS